MRQGGGLRGKLSCEDILSPYQKASCIEAFNSAQECANQCAIPINILHALHFYVFNTLAKTAWNNATNHTIESYILNVDSMLRLRRVRSWYLRVRAKGRSAASRVYPSQPHRVLVSDHPNASYFATGARNMINLKVAKKSCPRETLASPSTR